MSERNLWDISFKKKVTKQSFDINTFLKRMPLTGADIYYTHNIKVKQKYVLKPFS